MAGNGLDIRTITKLVEDSFASDPHRELALAAISDTGFPTPHHELWRHNRHIPFTDPALLQSSVSAQQPKWDAGSLSGFPLFQLTDGYLKKVPPDNPWQPNPENPSFETRLSPYIDLNLALHPESLDLFLPAKTVFKSPTGIVILDSGNGALTHPLVNLTVGSEAEATLFLINTGVPDVSSFRNLLIQIQLETQSRLNLITIDETGEKDTRLTHAVLNLAEGSILNWTHFTKAKGESRLDIFGRLNGEATELNLNALGLISGNGEADIHSQIDHNVPNTTSRETVKNIIKDEAHGIFNGKMLVTGGAYKTDSEQSNRNLLLSKSARMHSNPQLEILADDVRCSHGSATGQLDPEQLFYLRSRGLDPIQSRSLLVRGFTGEILDTISNQTLLDHCYHQLDQWLES